MNNATVATYIPKDGEISAVRFIPFGGTEQIELTIETVKQFLTSPTKSGKLPEKKDVVKFMMLCKSRELNPWEGDGFLVGYDSQAGPVFNLITSHQAFLKRAEASPEYDGLESGVVVRKNGDDEKEIPGEIVPSGYVLVGGWSRVFRKDRSHPMYKKLDLKSFDKGHSVWNTNKVGMIVKCAEADALRSSFPNKLGNLYIEGERVPVDVVEPGGDQKKPEVAAAPRPQAAGLKDALRKNTAADNPKEQYRDPASKEPLPAPAVIQDGATLKEGEMPESETVAESNESEVTEAAPPYPPSWKEDRKQIQKGASLSWEKHTPLMLKAKANTPEFKESAIYEMRFKLIEIYDKPVPSDDKLFDELKKAVDERAATSK